MNDDTKRWVEAWKRAAVALKAVRASELQAVDTAQSIKNLDGAFRSLRRTPVLRPSSGLVEQQRLFQKLRSRS